MAIGVGLAWCDTELAGGWPVTFVVDNRATSMLNTLGPEDDFFPGRFLADTACWSLLPAAVLLARHGRRRSAR